MTGQQLWPPITASAGKLTSLFSQSHAAFTHQADSCSTLRTFPKAQHIIELVSQSDFKIGIVELASF
jgi:hypothetical protein